MSGSSLFIFIPAIMATVAPINYAVVDTGQQLCYTSSGQNISCSGKGQDASYKGNQPNYTNNSDGTVTDDITHLDWQMSPDSNGDGTIDIYDKMYPDGAETYCSDLILGGKSDWRLPDIKTLYSLMNFQGEDVSSSQRGATPFIDTDYFDFGYGDTSAGERMIDAQWATTTIYVGKVMWGQQAMFGLNLADGRIKGYGFGGHTGKTFYVQCVRGNEEYGINTFVNNGDETITDNATKLMWQKYDNGGAIDWDSSISYCENASTAGYSDWRLPNAKELQSIVDYSRSPATTGSAAIDPVFNTTSFTNEAGQRDYGFYWTSTTHQKANGIGDQAVYIAFGRALGFMNNQWMDVHGAGAQRSDPKKLVAGRPYPTYQFAPTVQGSWAVIHGPQGDVVRGMNYARCVRDE